MGNVLDKFRDHDEPDDRLNQIISAYFEDAAKRVRDAILNPRGNTAGSQEWNQARASAIGTKILKIQEELKGRASGWTGKALSAAMKLGTQRAEQQAQDAGVRRVPQLVGSFHVINRYAAEKLARDTYSDLAKATDGMANVAQDTLRRMSATGVTNAEVNKILAGGVIEGKPTQAIRELRIALKKVHGETVTITDKNGDPMTFKAGYYAKMVAVTKTREAVCKARHSRLLDLGLDLVTIVGKISKNFCTAYLDKVFSISGRSDKYPPLSSLPGGGPPFHPNCSKSTAPYIEGMATEEEQKVADEPLPPAMLSTKDTSQLQRTFQDLQLHAQVNSTHKEVVASIEDQGAPEKPWDVINSIPRGKPGLEVSRSLNAIGAVHDLPSTMAHTSITSEVLRSGVLGEYRYTLDGRTLGIAINPNGTHEQLTNAHEFGHFIDHRAFGGGSEFGSKSLPVMKVIKRSDAIQQLRSLYASAPPRSKLKSHYAYLLDPAEMFARAYSQWIVAKSESKALQDQLAAVVSGSTPRQWHSSDFAAISAALDELFSGKGLMP